MALKELIGSFSKAPYDGTRGHTMKLENNVIHLDIRKYFFSQRVLDYWNALPQTAIYERTLMSQVM